MGRFKVKKLLQFYIQLNKCVTLFSDELVKGSKG